MIREKAVMAECTSPFMVSLVAGFQDDHFLYLLLEAVLGGEFFTYLQVGAHLDATKSGFPGFIAPALI